MKHILHEAASRGYADHGWLKSFHTFSFADYFNRSRMNFGVLRVLNDDWVDADQGFGTHPHRDMEIISIPLSGRLEHKDNTGSHSVLKSGEVQVMSAGTGVLHSEFNPSINEPASFLQIWVLPNQFGVSPRYEQKSFIETRKPGEWQLLVSPDRRRESLWIHQNAFFSWIDLKDGDSTNYQFYKPNQGAYAFVISGTWSVGNITLNPRDGLGILETDSIRITCSQTGSLLLMEVPIELPS